MKKLDLKDIIKLDDELLKLKQNEYSVVEFREAIREALTLAMSQVREETPDGYKIVYISEYFYDTLDKALTSISRGHQNSFEQPTVALRDAKGLVEFRRLQDKHEGRSIES